MILATNDTYGYIGKENCASNIRKTGKSCKSSLTKPNMEGIRAANGKKIEISGVELPEELIPGGDLVVKFEVSGTMQPLRVKLESSPDYPGVETIVVPQTGKIPCIGDKRLSE